MRMLPPVIYNHKQTKKEVEPSLRRAEPRIIGTVSRQGLRTLAVAQSGDLGRTLQLRFQLSLSAVQPVPEAFLAIGRHVQGKAAPKAHCAEVFNCLAIP